MYRIRALPPRLKLKYYQENVSFEFAFDMSHVTFDLRYILLHDLQRYDHDSCHNTLPKIHDESILGRMI
jgi:hypothetical protein